MIDSLLKAPLWIQIILMVLLIAIIGSVIYKVITSEKIKIGKEGIDLEDLDKVPPASPVTPVVEVKDEKKVR
jgi:hypothetical protein